MKSLQNILAEGLLDSDFDFELLTIQDLTRKAFRTKMNRNSFKHFLQEIDASFERCKKTDTPDYHWGIIEVDEKKFEIIVYCSCYDEPWEGTKCGYIVGHDKIEFTVNRRLPLATVTQPSWYFERDDDALDYISTLLANSATGKMKQKI